MSLLEAEADMDRVNDFIETGPEHFRPLLKYMRDGLAPLP